VQRRRRLQLEPVGKAGALRELQKLRAACQENVLPVIDFDAVDDERRGSPAQQAAAFEELDVRAELFEFNRRGQAREARTDDGYPLDSHDFTITRSFSVGASAARWRSGSHGSRAILPRMPS
jgi:hypothetical protein